MLILGVPRNAYCGGYLTLSIASVEIERVDACGVAAFSVDTFRAAAFWVDAFGVAAF